MAQAYMRGMSVEQDASATAPLITLFERDDAIAVPLLSQLRMAGYDVRSARTPVELFDILAKNLVTLVLVDLGAAAAGRREFWVALDSHRKGRVTQALTFRYVAPANDFDLDFEPSSRAIADVEVHGAHEFQRIIDAVRQRAPLHGPAPSLSVSYTPDGAIQPLGAALGIASPPYSPYSSPSMAPGQYPMMGQAPGGYNGYGGAPLGGFAPAQSSSFAAHAATTPFPPGAFGSSPLPYGQPAPAQPSPFASSPFATPASANPFGPNSAPSPFAQPYDSNPFSRGLTPPTPPSSPFAQTNHNGNPFSPMPQSEPSAPSAPPPWGMGSGGYLADTPDFMNWQTPQPEPLSFGSEPGARPPFAFPSQTAITHRPVSAPHSPVFQDAWTPPETDTDMETTALTEDAFQPRGAEWSPPDWQGPAADAWAATSQPLGARSQPDYGMRERPWDAPRVQSGGLGHDAAQSDPLSYDYDSPSDFSDSTAALAAAPVATQPKRDLPLDLSETFTPTETALGSVLIEGSLLTHDKLETLRGIKEMLAGVNQPRKLGELAIMFKFLSADQLLAALLVSRGLLTTQQISTLGRQKQEMAARGVNHDLATLLVTQNLLSA
ncbi:MAG: hypothetical protein KGO05_04085, partial [Chloroflexota bacterium]|nr:hypothetical protein [Chloroflexota bacterium]